MNFPARMNRGKLKWQEFEEDVQLKRKSDAGLAEARAALQIVENNLSEKRNDKFMIIARSPLRVTLGGGGTDLPSYYEKFGGFLIAAAIDKYVYITLHDTFVPDLIVKYSELERVPDATQVETSDFPRGICAASAWTGIRWN